MVGGVVQVVCFWREGEHGGRLTVHLQGIAEILAWGGEGTTSSGVAAIVWVDVDVVVPLTGYFGYNDSQTTKQKRYLSQRTHDSVLSNCITLHSAATRDLKV